MFLKARQSKVHAGQETVTKNQTKWNTLYTPDYLSNLTRNQNFLSKSIESRKYSMFLEARHSKVHAGQETVTKNQSRCNRRKRAIRGIRNAIRSRKYVTERVRRCENKKRARRGKDKCIKGCDLENGGGLRRLNLFLVHSSQTNRERKRKREREKERERERENEYPAPTRRRCFARKIRSVPLVGILELFFSPLSFSRPSPCSLSISAAAVTAAYSNAANPSLERSFFPSTWLQRNDGQPCVRFLGFYRRLIIKTNNTGW